MFDTEAELISSSNHETGDIGYANDTNALYIFINGEWKKTCGCDSTDSSLNKRDTEDVKRNIRESDSSHQASKESEGAVSRLWTGIKAWLGQESSEISNRENT